MILSSRRPCPPFLSEQVRTRGSTEPKAEHFLPRHVRAVFNALRFQSPDFEPLNRLNEEDWKRTLDFCDRSQLTLALGLACSDQLHDSICQRIRENFRNNAERWIRVQKAYSDIAAIFEAEGLEFAVLKGFSHCPRFVADPRHRWQGDIDLLLPEEQVYRAFDAAARLGYEPIMPGDRHPIDHLPTLIRKTGWEWRGDYFDVDIPLALELHFRLWDERTERFGPQGLEQFWERRRRAVVGELEFVALHPTDAMANSALHLLRHLLRGSLRPSHVYELAWLLDHSAGDDSLWGEWQELHHASLRRLEAIAFALAQKWFDCRLPERPRVEVEALPPQIKRWLELYWAAPLAADSRPNKDELWLHLSLLESPSARLEVLRRRLLPSRLPGPVDAVHTPKEQRSFRIRWRRRWRHATYSAHRVAYHLKALPATAASAVRWFGRA